MISVESKIHGYIIKVYNRLMQGKLINRNNKVIRRIRAMLYHNICYSCVASFGNKNSERRFYVIRCPHSSLGFFGLYNYVLYHIKIAEKFGCEPIVDWKYYPNSAVMSEEDFGKKNAWDFYFKPISEVGLEEVYQSKYVRMSSGEYNGSLDEVYNAEELLNSKRIVNEYMRPNKTVEDKFFKRFSDFGMGSEKILGILCRGTDFTAAKPQYHAVCPNAEQMINIIEEKMKEWGDYRHIFVATEDKTILLKLQQYYGERLLVNQQTMIDYHGKKWLNDCYAQMDKDICYQVSLEYFVSILLLSECDALIAPLVGGTLGAMRIKGNYKRVYITQLGSYE